MTVKLLNVFLKVFEAWDVLANVAFQHRKPEETDEPVPHYYPEDHGQEASSMYLFPSAAWNRHKLYVSQGLMYLCFSMLTVDELKGMSGHSLSSTTYMETSDFHKTGSCNGKVMACLCWFWGEIYGMDSW